MDNLLYTRGKKAKPKTDNAEHASPDNNSKEELKISININFIL